MKYLLFFLSLSILHVTGCHHHEEHEHGTLSLRVSNPIRQDTNIPRQYVSQIHSSQHIELKALEKGYVSEIFVDEGQTVSEGTLLFQIMPRLYEAEVQKAQAEVDAAKIEYENTQKLRRQNIVADSELNLVKAKLDKAMAELSLAKVHLDFTKVTAPFSGISGRLHIRKGSLVEEGELLTTLSDNHEMWVYFNVPEAEYIEMKQQSASGKTEEVQLMLANNTPYKHKGHITAIESDFNNQTGNIAFRATFPNPDGLLRHGQTGNVLLVTQLKDALVIPQKATYEVLDKHYVYLVDEKNEVHSKSIQVLSELPDLFVIREDLSVSDRILVDGLRKVRHGDIIKPVSVPSKQIFANLKVYAE